MGLFSRKPKVSIEDFSRDFYDGRIFHLAFPNRDVASLSVEAYNQVVEADHSFSAVDQAAFQHELTALWIELFGLACQHHLKRHDYALRQVIFTQSYLEQEGRVDIWGTMLDYNEAISVSTQDILERGGVLQAGTRHLTALRWLKGAEWSTAMMQSGANPQCVSRVMNRLASQDAWRRGYTLWRLKMKLAVRLQWDTSLKSEGLLLLGVALLSQYNSAKAAIKSVNLQVA